VAGQQQPFQNGLLHHHEKMLPKNKIKRNFLFICISRLYSSCGTWNRFLIWFHHPSWTLSSPPFFWLFSNSFFKFNVSLLDRIRLTSSSTDTKECPPFFL
jgi:hypothetical protein